MLKRILTTLTCTALIANTIAADALTEAISIQDAFSAVADKAFPAVVVIKVSKKVSQSNNRNSPQMPPGHEFFYGPRHPRRNQDQQQKVHGSGSGFIINKDGYIVTNHHVVGDSDEIMVEFQNKKEFKATLIGSDKKSDLAVIKINSEKDLPYLTLADSDKVRVGHWAIAIGAPFNMDFSMTVGVVSQKARSVGLNVYENYIQTDASINPGNSGGPLLNISGEVIGVNDFIISPNGGQSGNIGLGFAIPSNMAKNIIDQLIDMGKVERPWVGIAMQDLNAKMSKHLNVTSGVLVREAFENNPAANYGLETGDVITHVGDTVVKNSHDLQFAILDFKPGEMIPFTVIRDGEKSVIKVKADRQKKDEVAGVNSVDLSRQNNKMLSSYGVELTEEKSSVYISKVLVDSSAELSGLRRGMQIKAINRKRINKVQDVQNALKKNSNSVLLYVSDGQSNYFVVLSK